MQLLKTYIQNFLSRAGSYVFMATILARLLSFIASWIPLQFVNNEKLGIVLFAWNIIAFLLPFVGAGLPQSLLRYGALLTNEEDKQSLLHYVVKNGTFASIFLSFFIAVIALLYPFNFENTGLYVAVFSLCFIPHFLLSAIKIQLRLQHNNKTFALVETVYNMLLVLLVFILSYLYKENGYISALILTPALTSVIFFNKIKNNKKQAKKLSITNKKFWKYGVFASLSNVTTQLLFVVDIFLIGYLLKNAENVTYYRYISLIPFSILFIPRVFITTDFVTITENSYQKKYITNYIKSYLLLFTLLSIFINLFSWLFAKEILLIFGEEFANFTKSFIVLMIGVSGIFIFRNLFGNLLSSIGKAHTNYYITSIGLILNFLSNYYLIPKFGVLGASITSAVIMWITGFISCVWFIALYKNYAKITSPSPN